MAGLTQRDMRKTYGAVPAAKLGEVLSFTALPELLHVFDGQTAQRADRRASKCQTAVFCHNHI
jgi:hypothetical protein